MYSVQIVIFLILNSALRNIDAASSVITDSSAHVFDIEIPEGQTVEQYIQTVTDFWTDERLKKAKPKPLIRTDTLSTDKSFNDRRTSDDNEKPTLIEGTVPASSKTLKRDGYPITVGKVFFVDEGEEYMCSASVVTADNKDMIFTAGHCVYSTTNLAYVKNFVFIPQYENGLRPYGTWPARCLYAISDWVKRLDHNFDVAIAILYTLDDKHIQDVVGSQGIGFNYGHSAVVYSFGYPSNYQEGEMMTYCTATKSFADIPDYSGDAMSCTMNQGCSGGPWFESYNISNLIGIQTSVNSFMLRDVPNVMHGPYFGSVVQSLYNRAKDNGTCYSKANRSAFSVVVLLPLVFLQYLKNTFFK
jgi:V8-like Glu-specific endopeptidase